jgi:hypothetical protein
MGTDSLKSALEIEDHVLKAENIDPVKLCLIRDDLHMRAHLRSKGHFLTPGLKEIPRTRVERFLQWHTKNRHENIFFMNEKIFTIEGQYNNQNNKIYAQMSLEVSSEGAGRPSYIMVWWGVSHQGLTPHNFCEKGVKRVPECIKRTCYKEL